MSKKYSMFIGRWQPWHQGHRWLIDQRLDDGKNVLICIRDVESNKNQPWTADEVMLNLAVELKDLIEEGRIKIIKIPDVESINYGRGVGYDGVITGSWTTGLAIGGVEIITKMLLYFFHERIWYKFSKFGVNGKNKT